MAKVGIVGGSGYVGAELLRLAAAHSELEVMWATGETLAGSPIGETYPHLRAAYGDTAFTPLSLNDLDGIDVAFVALPHGQSQALMRDLRDRATVVIDLGADFRLRDAATYEQWYGEPHTAPEMLGDFVYGLPELNRSAIKDARAVAAPGCYPTAAALALAPLVNTGLVRKEGIVVDAASGVSGAGRQPKPGTTFGAVDENFAAYGLLDHRHTPEMEQTLGAQVLFTPHLAPMVRGILATCYARPTGPTSTDEVRAALRAAYDAEPFVSVVDEPPATKSVTGSNSALVTAYYDERTDWIVVISAIDNLVKGAAGQAVQCANLVLGLDERTGLSITGLYP